MSVPTEAPDVTSPSSTGLDPPLAGLLCYLLGPITGILFLVIERRNRFVRFHAMQSTVTFLALFVVAFVLGIVPLLGPLLSAAVGLLELVLWILLMVKAFQGECYRLPWVGDIAAERVGIA